MAVKMTADILAPKMAGCVSVKTCKDQKACRNLLNIVITTIGSMLVKVFRDD